MSVVTAHLNDMPNNPLRHDMDDHDQVNEEIELKQRNKDVCHSHPSPSPPRNAHEERRLSMTDKTSSPCPTLSMDRYIIPFYHSTFEFYAPFAIDLASFISLDEYERLLTFINTQLPTNLPGRGRRLALLFRAFVVLLFLGGLGLLILPYLYYMSHCYERDFKAFLIRVAAVLSEKNIAFAKHNIRFSLRNAQLRRMDPRQEKEWTGNLYHYSISIDTLSLSSKKATTTATREQESILRSHSLIHDKTI